MWKKLLFLITVSVGILIVVLGGNNYNFKSGIIVAEYDVFIINEAESEKAGIYSLKTETSNKSTTVQENIALEISLAQQAETSRIVNEKKYTFDADERLVGFSESEYNDGRLIYTQEIIFSFAKKDILATVKINDTLTKTVKFPNHSLSVSCFSSELFRIIQSCDFSTGSTHYSIDINQCLNTFEAQEIETIRNEYMGDISCAKVINENSLGKKEYWINNGILVKQKENINDTAVLVFDLNFYSRK